MRLNLPKRNLLFRQRSKETRSSVILLTETDDVPNSIFDVIAVSSSYSVHRIVCWIHNVEIQVPRRCCERGSPLEGIPSWGNGGPNRVVPNTPQGLHAFDFGAVFALVISRIDIGDWFGEKEMIVMIGKRDDTPILVSRHFGKMGWKETVLFESSV